MVIRGHRATGIVGTAEDHSEIRPQKARLQQYNPPWRATAKARLASGVGNVAVARVRGSESVARQMILETERKQIAIVCSELRAIREPSVPCAYSIPSPLRPMYVH